MTRLLLLLALALAATVDGPGDHTVWEDEDAAREAALDAVEDLDDVPPAPESGD